MSSHSPAGSEPISPAAVEAALDGLRHLGAAPGVRVALQVRPDSHGIAAILAAARTGAVVSLLHPDWAEAETLRVLKAFQPRVFIPASDGEAPLQMEAGLRVVPVGMLRRQVRDVSAARHDTTGVPTSWVLWSSGTTTGRPRGLWLAHKALKASSLRSAERLGLGSDDVWLATLSPAHVGGLALILRAEFLGSRVVPLDRFDAPTFNRVVDAGVVSHASLVPTQLLRVLDDRGDEPFPDSLRVLLVGGAPTPGPLLERALSARAPVALTWGMTEMASQVATAPPARVRSKPGTVGPPLPDVEVRIESFDGPVVEEGNPGGELLLRAPMLARGIFTSPDAPPAPICDAEGWYRTGDLGRLDAEGDLWILGRVSDRIISGGVNVEPAGVEAEVLSHPQVREVAVLGIPDEEWGERVVAIVVPIDPSDPPGLEELRTRLGSRIQAARLPRQLVVVQALPRGPNGKVDKQSLRRLAGD